MKNLKLITTALITPFKLSSHSKQALRSTAFYEIDWPSLEKLVHHQIANGIEGFVINGTTAESPVLSPEEVKQLFMQVRSWLGKDFPLIVGTGSNCTQKTIQATQLAESWGADAALVVVPYYNKPPQRGLVHHFSAVAETTALPIILYNVPGRTITGLSLETIQKLSEIKNIVGLKEATGDIDFLRKIKMSTPDTFVLLSGDDLSYVDFLAAGGHGVISVSSHILPQQMVRWRKSVQEHHVESAKTDLLRYKKLIEMLFIESNPIPVKKALQFMGIIDSAVLRAPLLEMEETLALELQSEMKRLGVIL